MSPTPQVELFDVVVVGGGPAGLSAALTLGRSRRRVLLADGGPRRNEAASHIHNFLTRDGTPPAELRRLGRAELAAYPQVQLHDGRVEAIEGERGAFSVRLAETTVQARRVLLCTGMVDLLPPLPGLQEAWGRSAFICPYCHGWEVQDRRIAVLAPTLELVEFALLLRGWSRQVVLLTDGRFALPPEVRARMEQGGLQVEERRLARLVAPGGVLSRIEFEEGAPLPAEALFMKPPQRQVAVVEALGLAVDGHGLLVVDPMHRETSRPGIHAGGDLVTPAQGAIQAAALGSLAAAVLNHTLVVERALAGSLP